MEISNWERKRKLLEELILLILNESHSKTLSVGCIRAVSRSLYPKLENEEIYDCLKFPYFLTENWEVINDKCVTLTHYGERNAEKVRYEHYQQDKLFRELLRIMEYTRLFSGIRNDVLEKMYDE